MSRLRAIARRTTVDGAVPVARADVAAVAIEGADGRRYVSASL